MDKGTPESVSAVAPAKINLVLRVGPPDASGYHPLTTVFQAVDIWDRVTVSSAHKDELTVVGAGDLSGVPLDYSNIVWRAVEALAERTGVRHPVGIQVEKNIPVAGGMAGGSADAAATLVAVNAHWDLGLDHQALREVARTLGSDVPFSLQGGLAIGTGRGDQLTPMTRTTPLHIVIVRSSGQLSTPEIYRRLDILREGRSWTLPRPDELGLAQLGHLGPRDVAHVAANDLGDAAVAAMPELAESLRAVTEAGALAALVSGSGPTIWGIARDRAHAEDITDRVVQKGYLAQATSATDRGTHLD